MAQLTSGVRSVLSLPAMYGFAQRAIGSVRFREVVATEYIRPEPGLRVLDIGCGPGDILEHLGDVDYVGTDLSEAYIESATRRFGDRGQFHVASVADLDRGLLGEQNFDVVIALGVLHHISDADADSLFQTASDRVVTGGGVVTVDPCFHDDQHRIARALAERDRGQAVRRPEKYRAIAAVHFHDASVTVRTDLLRLPYSHAIVTARRGLT